MRNVMTVGTNTLIWATILASCCQFGFSSPINDDTLSKSLDDSSETDSNLIKKDWSKSLHGWGKRSWSSLHGEWGKRDSPDYPIFDKKAWQSLQGGWGKRSPTDDDYNLSNIVDGISDNGPIPEYSYIMENDNDDEKRAWNNLHSSGWGKRSGRKWGNFKGSWGKREPAWTNLKGIWGKRSGPLQ